MSSLIYLQISGNLTHYGVILTVTTNSLLTHLTFSSVHNITFTYKCLIGAQAILGILFSLTEVLVHPFLHSFNASYIFFSVSFTSQEFKFIGSLLLALYSLIYMNIIICLAIQFIYRYFVVMSSKKLMFFKGFRVVIWIFYNLFFTFIWILSLHQIYPDDFSNGYLKEEMTRNYHTDVSYMASFQAVYYNGSLRYTSISGVIGFSSVILFQYIIILFCGIRIHLCIRSMTSLASSQAKRLQAQLFRALVLQITVPSILYNGPVLFLYIIPLLDLKWSVPSGVMISVFSFYPAVDSFILMYTVTEYNRTIKSKSHS